MASLSLAQDKLALGVHDKDTDADPRFHFRSHEGMFLVFLSLIDCDEF